MPGKVLDMKQCLILNKFTHGSENRSLQDFESKQFLNQCTFLVPDESSSIIVDRWFFNRLFILRIHLRANKYVLFLGSNFVSKFLSFAHAMNMKLSPISQAIVFANHHCCKRNRYNIKFFALKKQHLIVQSEEAKTFSFGLSFLETYQH